jgi:hypothetical protein
MGERHWWSKWHLRLSQTFTKFRVLSWNWCWKYIS